MAYRNKTNSQFILLLPALVLTVLSTVAFTTTKTPISKKNLSKVKLQSDTDQVFSAVQVSPIPKGGELNFNKFLSNNIHYPSIDKERNIQGRVYITFIVEKNGSLSNIKVVRAPSTTLGEEAVRAVKLSPLWSPGMQNGKPVRVAFTIPVNFSFVNNDNLQTKFAALNKHLLYAINYPESAINNSLSGFVYAHFVVNESKSLTLVNIIKSTNVEMNTAVINAFKSYISPTEIPTGDYLAACNFYFMPNGTTQIRITFSSYYNRNNQ